MATAAPINTINPQGNLSLPLSVLIQKGTIAKDVFVMATAGVEKRKLSGKKTEEIQEEEN